MTSTENNSINNKRVAIIHDAVAGYGGGEKVLSVFLRIFPHADIYTSLVNQKKIKKIQAFKNLNSTFMQNISVAKKMPRLIQLLSPFVWRSVDISSYEIVITHAGFYLANLVHLQQKISPQLRIHYSITPAKNLYFQEYRQWFESPMHFLYYPFLRLLDNKSAQKADLIWAVSKAVSSRIRRIYKRNARVLYPPVSIPKKPPVTATNKKKHFTYIGRIDKEKSVDIIIKAFNINKQQLVIVGEGKQEARLRKISERNIKFAGFKKSREIQAVLKKTKAFIHTAIHDDFPLAPVEAMAHGVPVIAFYSGGVKESVVQGKTGIFFRENTPQALAKAIKKFETLNFNPLDCYKQATKFSQERFEREVIKILETEYEKFKKNLHQ